MRGWFYKQVNGERYLGWLPNSSTYLFLLNEAEPKVHTKKGKGHILSVYFYGHICYQACNSSFFRFKAAALPSCCRNKGITVILLD